MKKNIVKIHLSKNEYNEIEKTAYKIGFDTVEEFLRCAALTQYEILTKKVVTIRKGR